MRYASEGGTALNLARKENIRLDIDGVARLASKNLLPDPTLSDFLPEGTMRYWPRLQAPPVATGRNVYIREPGERFTRQNDSPLPRERAGYAQRLALVEGAPMPGAKSPYDLLHASAPFLRPIGLSNSGYPAGTYLRSYAWAIRVGRGRNQRWLLTDLAPPVSFTLAEDQSTEQPLPTEVPEGVDGIAIVDSLPDGDFGLMYVQRIIDVRDFVPESYTMDGPPRYARRAPGGDPSENQTYVGAYGRWKPLRLRKRPAPVSLLWMDVHTSWRFRTRFGWSASQPIRRIVHHYVERNRWFEVRPPFMPLAAEAWIPQFQGPDGQWQEPDYGLVGDELGLRRWAQITTGDSEKLNLDITYERAELTREDNTGVPGPDEALQAPLTFGKARIGPGPKAVRVTDVYTTSEGREIESPPSIPNTINLQDQQGILVDFRELAEEGDVVPNGDFEEQKASGGLAAPRGFFYPTTRNANLQVNARNSVVEFDDSTGRTTDDAVFESDLFRIAPVPYTVRGGVVLNRADGGLAYISFRFWNAAGNNLLATRVLATNSTPGKKVQDFTVGPIGSGCDLEWPEGTAKASYVCRLQGSSGDSRNLAGRFIHLGMFRGKAAPRKAGEEESPVPAEEPETEPYPPGSYMRVVENPSWAQAKGNGFEYYGSFQALVRPRRFASGLRVPVEPNKVYCLQADYQYEGLEAGAEIMPVSVKTAKGEATDAQRDGLVGGTLLAPSSASGSGQAHIVIETGPDAAYLEIEDSTLGSGLLRVWGLQLAYGSLPTAWTNEVAPSGILASTFDTRTPGVYESLKHYFGYERFLDGGVVADEPEGTSVPVRFRSRASSTDTWSPYTNDLSSLALRRFIEVEAAPQRSTVDAGVSPEISSIFLLAEPRSSVLLRPDGTEYDGGVLVDGFPAMGYGDNARATRYGDGRLRVRQSYPAPKVLEGITLIAFTDDTATEVSFDASRGEREFVIEGFGVSYLVRILNVRFTANRRYDFARDLTGASQGGSHYVHVADDVTAEVLQHEKMDQVLDQGA